MGVVRSFVASAIQICVFGLAVICVASWIPAWPLALFEHFRIQYVACGAIVIAGAAMFRLRFWFDIALISTLLHALPIVADLTASHRAGPGNGILVRVLVLNVHTESSGFARVRQLIAEERPDVIGLVEVDRRWLDALAPAMVGYQRIEQPRDDNFGVALYARGSIAGAITDFESPLPSVDASISLHGATFEVILTHPLPPVREGAIDQQGRQFDAIAARAGAATTPVLIMGDFNATPWSRPFQRLLGASGLCDSRAGFGAQASYPADFAPMRIPIDHLLATCAVGIRDRRIGRDVGSDHLPVIVDLVFAP